MSKKLVTGRQLLLIFPALVGAISMMWAIHQSSFLGNFSAPNLVWMVVLFMPFAFIGVMAWRSRPGVVPTLLVVLPALLLTCPSLVCFSDGFAEGSQYVLVLSPVYLWCVVAIAAMLEIGTRNRNPPEFSSISKQ